MAMHLLSQIDLEHKTAVCSVCGYTEIHVPYHYQEGESRIHCMHRHMELNRYKRMWAVLTPQERNLARKEKHTLTEIDPELRRGVCAICGPTDIYFHSAGAQMGYRCATYQRLRHRSEELQDFMQQPAGHDLLFEIYQQKKAIKGLFSWSDLRQINLGDLSQFQKPKPRVRSLQEAAERKRKQFEENTRLVNEFKRSHSCKRCGARALEPRKFRFFEVPFPPDQALQRLIHKLDPERLRMELEKRDLHCPTCHQDMLKQYNKRAQSLRSAERLRSTLAKHSDEGAANSRRG
jgi:ribosomal protein L37E